MMDCKAFDDVVLDLVYDDGDGPPSVRDEAREHAEGCARCADVLSTLRRARDVASVPPLDVPEGLEARILRRTVDRERAAPPTSWLRRLDRAVSLAGSYAMRPQLAMAALLVLMVGTSLLLLRARPAGPGAVRITEVGVPAEARPQATTQSSVVAADRRAAPDSHGARRDDERSVAKMEAPAAAAPRAMEGPPPTPAAAPADQPTATATAEAKAPEPAASASAAPPQDAAFADAMDDYKAKRFGDAVRGFDIVANGGGTNAPTAALLAARATRFSAGCGAALPRFDAVATRFAGTSVAAEATWESATCYREVGQIDRARQLFQSLRRVAGYRDRAESELATLDQQRSERGGGVPGKAAAPAPAKPASGAGKSDAKANTSY